MLRSLLTKVFPRTFVDADAPSHFNTNRALNCVSLPRRSIPMGPGLREMGRLHQQRLFDDHPQPDHRRDLMRRVAAFVAPVAADKGSVVDDPVSLDVADAIYEAFGDLDADGGLTRSELLAASLTLVCPARSRTWTRRW